MNKPTGVTIQISHEGLDDLLGKLKEVRQTLDDIKTLWTECPEGLDLGNLSITTVNHIHNGEQQGVRALAEEISRHLQRRVAEAPPKEIQELIARQGFPTPW